MRRQLISTLLLGLLAGCAHREQIAVVSDSAVVVAGKAGGTILERPKPTDGRPLVTSLVPGTACIADDQLLAKLGPTCSHESENTADVRPTSGDLAPGKPRATGRVSWYCDGKLVVRVVWAPCDANDDGKMDGFSPIEIGVATHPHPG